MLPPVFSHGFATAEGLETSLYFISCTSTKWLEENSSKAAQLPVLLRLPNLPGAHVFPAWKPCFPQPQPQKRPFLQQHQSCCICWGKPGKTKDQRSSSLVAQSSVVLGLLKPAHHNTSCSKYDSISLREEGEYAQHSRNVTAPSCTLPYLETDEINPTDSQLLLLLLCFCSGWHTDTHTQCLLPGSCRRLASEEL